ncbi:hypothetical protein HPP92_020383 [Vanilla planifolia]|uniref:4-coumarate--CoA ligase n=1 Tax=Vanilla planifolia TaxID=51239 RepID=A0A835Q5V6_VANPL|nr:hypothetical protein HPP92_020383 [Vanilla planifolia]
MYEMHFGVPMSGAVLNTLNIRLDATTVSVLLHHSSSRLLFVDVLSLPLASSAISLLPSDQPRPLVVPIEDPYEDSSSLSAFDLTYEKLLCRGDPDFPWLRPKTEWSPMVLNYTSGTTSAPKGVVHSHRSLFLSTLGNLLDWSVPHHSVFLWTLPMFHSNGWCFPWGISAVAGTNVCIRRFDGPSIFASIADRHVTHLCCAPVVLSMLTNVSPVKRRPLPNTVHIMTAGSPPPAAILSRIEAIGFSVAHGYGLTETGGIAVSCPWKADLWDSLPAGERSRMKARHGVRTSTMAAANVVDSETGRRVPQDGETMGEVVLRGGNLMQGYLKNEEATREAIRGGWFFTGDVAVVHTDGYIEIKDRSKDVIISGGENISTVEVESVIYGHPSVVEAAVVGRPDEFWGETPCAFIALKEGESPTDKELMEWCRQRMPHYTVPKMVVFLPELPKTSTGKIQKYLLRNMAKKLGPAAAESRARSAPSPASKL